MERDGQLAVLACGDDMVIDRGQDFDAVANGLDVGRTDEDHRKWLFVGRCDSGNCGIGRKTTQLATIGIAAHADVHRGEVVRVEHDEAGAGAKHRHSVQNGLADGLVQRFVADDARHGGAFAARDDETAVSFRHLGTVSLPVGQVPDFQRFVAKTVQHLFVFDECALKGKDCDCHWK